MKTVSIDHANTHIVAVAAVLIFALLLRVTDAAATDDKTQTRTPQSQKQIQITADQLVTHGDQNYAEFIGNVEAVQENFELRSDRLRIYYRSGTGITNSAATNEEPLKKIVASGNVRIKSDNQNAQTDAVEYTVASGLLVLTGENSTLTDGKNSIKGSKISLNRLTGEVSVEGSPKSRVRAVVYSNQGINPSSNASKTKRKPKKSPE